MYELFLVEQGVEMELEADLDEVVRVLDREVSGFGADTRRFKLEAPKDEEGPHRPTLPTDRDDLPSEVS